MPVVVAMQYKMDDDDAVTFAEKVYEQIGEGKAIDEAVKAGICALGSNPPAWNPPRFGTPVFFLQAEDAAFLSAESLADPEEKKSLSETVRCPFCTTELTSYLRRC